MKNIGKLLLITLFFLNIIPLAADFIHDFKEYPQNGPIKEWLHLEYLMKSNGKKQLFNKTIIYYKKSGQLWKLISYDQFNQFKISITFYYNHKGQLETETYHYPDGIKTGKKIYRYDLKNKMREIDTQGEKARDYKILFLYDQFDQIYKKLMYFKSSKTDYIIYQYYYNKGLQLIKKEITDSNEQRQGTFKYQYDHNKQMIQFDRLNTFFTFEYDQQGRKKKCLQYDLNGRALKKWHYFYDQKNNVRSVDIYEFQSEKHQYLDHKGKKIFLKPKVTQEKLILIEQNSYIYWTD